jgi:hypothetical protein
MPFKPIAIILFLSISSICGAQDIKDLPNLKVVSPGQVACPTTPFAKLSVDCWIGQRVIFIPRKPEHSYEYYDQSHDINGKRKVAVSLASGKVGKITNIEDNRPRKGLFLITITMEDTGDNYYADGLLDYKDSFHLNNMAFIKDIEDARKLYIGRKFWKIGDNWAEITDITVSDDQLATARFFYKTATGEGTVDISLGDTNLLSPMTHPFKAFFAETDPETERKSQELAAEKELKKQMKTLRDKYKKYKWSKKVWDSIETGKVFIGMMKLQATLAWGEPKSVNRTIGSWGEHEQWVYTHKSYLYFENGILKSIQN